MSIQKGPWKIDEWNNIVDKNEHLLILTGVKHPTSGDIDQVETGESNKELIAKAPELNHVVGKVLEIMNNPYANNDWRMDKFYILVDELRQAYLDKADYTD